MTELSDLAKNAGVLSLKTMNDNVSKIYGDPENIRPASEVGMRTYEQWRTEALGVERKLCGSDDGSDGNYFQNFSETLHSIIKTCDARIALDRDVNDTRTAAVRYLVEGVDDQLRDKWKCHSIEDWVASSTTDWKELSDDIGLAISECDFSPFEHLMLLTEMSHIDYLQERAADTFD